MRNKIEVLFKTKKETVLFGFLVVLIMILTSMLLFLFTTKNLAGKEETDIEQYLETNTSETNNNTAQTVSESEIDKVDEKKYVDIKGAVHHPGVYQIDGEMRLMDVIEAAGGFLVSADQTNINLALKLTDQMVIYVPQKGEEIDTAAFNTAIDEKSKDEEIRVNVNTADLTELQVLSGIGAKKAQEIINYREENGSFQTIEEITKVSGIGEKTFELLKNAITVGN